MSIFNKKLAISVVAIFILFVSTANASGLKIVSIEMSNGAQTSDGKGIYSDILKSILPSSGYSYDVSIVPFKRALSLFSKKLSDCIWPIDNEMLKKLINNEKDLIQSKSIFRATRHIFTLPARAPVSSYSEIKGLRVGVTTGSNIINTIKESSGIVYETPTHKSKIIMLERNRVDAIVGWMPDIASSIDTDYSVPKYDKNLVLSESTVRLACRKFDRSIKFIKQVDSSINIFLGSDEFMKILKNHDADSIL